MKKLNADKGIILLALIVLSAFILFIQLPGKITGMAVLDDYSSQSINNSIMINEESTFYLDLNNSNYTTGKIDVSGNAALNPSVDILDDGSIDWSYSSEFTNTETIDFIDIIKDYLANCGSYPCNVPFKVRIDSGELVFNNLILPNPKGWGFNKLFLA